MSRPRLSIHLDDDGRVYAPGEMIQGRLQVRVDEEVAFEQLLVSVGWRTTGKANSVEGPVLEFELREGRRKWSPGETAVLLFSCAVPVGPSSYDGRKVNIEWSVRARASIPWSVDPKDEAVIRVAAPPGEGVTIKEKEDAGAFEFGCAVTCLVIFLLCVAVILMAGPDPGVGWYIAGGLTGVIALVMLPISRGYRRAGKVRLEVGPSPVAPGGELAVRLTAVPRKNLKPKRVTAVLTGKEISVQGSGKSKSTTTEELGKATAVLEGPKLAVAGREAVWAGILHVPPDAAPSFEANPHKVEWKVEASIVIDWLPDPDYEVVVIVG